MPVHETEGGYKYGKTGKTYKNKKDAVKQAIAIAYSKAKEKGRKPSQEEIKEEISGNPDKVEKTASAELFNPTHGNMTMDRNQMLRNYAGRLRKKASVLEKQAKWGEWAAKAGEWLSSPENLGRLGIGGGTWLASYLASGLLDPKKKNRGLRAILSGIPAALAATKGYDWAAERFDNARTAAEQARRTAEANKYSAEQDRQLAAEAASAPKAITMREYLTQQRAPAVAAANKHIAEQNARLRDDAVNQQINDRLTAVRNDWAKRAEQARRVRNSAQNSADTGPSPDNEKEYTAFSPVTDPTGFDAGTARQAQAEKDIARSKALRAAQIRQQLADMDRREKIKQGGEDPYAHAAGELTPSELAKRNAPMDIPRIGPDIKGAIERERSDKGRGFIPTLWSTLVGASNQSKMQRDLDAKIKARNERAALEAELKQLTGK